MLRNDIERCGAWTEVIGPAAGVMAEDVVVVDVSVVAVDLSLVAVVVGDSVGRWVVVVCGSLVVEVVVVVLVVEVLVVIVVLYMLHKSLFCVGDINLHESIARTAPGSLP